MRVLHTSDWHLGQELHGVDRLFEQSRVLDQIVDICLARDVDALVVAGDVYHAANPSVRAQKAFYQTLARLSREAPCLSAAVIGGNHDSPSRLELPLALPLNFGAGDEGRLHALGSAPRQDGAVDPAGCARLLRRRDGSVGAAAALVPFLRPGDLASPGDAAALFDAATAAARALAAEAGAPEAPTLLAAHLHAAGGEVSDESERPIMIGGEEAIALSAFPASADYVALGHLHRPQTLQRRGPMVRYAGSILPLSATERTYRHSVSLVTLGDGPPRVEEIPLARPRAFLRAPESGALEIDALEAALAALGGEIDAPSTPELTPFLEAAVRLTGPEPGLRARLEAALGDAPARLVRITREAANAAAQADPALAWERLTPSGAFERLHAREFGAAPDPDLEAAFQTLLAEDGSAADDAPAGGPEDRREAGG